MQADYSHKGVDRYFIYDGREREREIDYCWPRATKSQILSAISRYLHVESEIFIERIQLRNLTIHHFDRDISQIFNIARISNAK